MDSRTKVDIKNLPEGYEVHYVVARGYDSPDRWYEPLYEGKVIGSPAGYSNASKAKLACWQHWFVVWNKNRKGQNMDIEQLQVAIRECRFAVQNLHDSMETGIPYDRSPIDEWKGVVTGLLGALTEIENGLTDPPVGSLVELVETKERLYVGGMVDGAFVLCMKRDLGSDFEDPMVREECAAVHCRRSQFTVVEDK